MSIVDNHATFSVRYLYQAYRVTGTISESMSLHRIIRLESAEQSLVVHNYFNSVRIITVCLQDEGVKWTSVVELHDVRKDANYYIADNSNALSSTYDVMREENLHDRVDNGTSPYEVIHTEDLSGNGIEPSSVYGVVRKESICDSADTIWSPYDVVGSEHLPPPDNETIESVKAAKTPTSLLPPPLPPPMIPSLPPPYGPGEDSLLESVANGSVQILENGVVVTKDESRQGNVFSTNKTKDDTEDDEQEEKVIVEVSR